jgi:hypothetical protein
LIQLSGHGGLKRQEGLLPQARPGFTHGTSSEKGTTTEWSGGVMNEISIVGNVTDEPVYYVGKNRGAIRFSVAVNRSR